MSLNDLDILKLLLGRLDRDAFSAFALESLGSRRAMDPIEPFLEVGDGIFIQPLLDSYGGSIHCVIVLHYVPIQLFGAPDRLSPGDDPDLVSRLVSIEKHYRGVKGAFGMVSPCLVEADALAAVNIVTNYNIPHAVLTADDMIPRYARLLDQVRLGDRRLYVGCYDSFIELAPDGTRDSFRRFIASHQDGLRISLAGREIHVGPFATETCVAVASAADESLAPHDPVYVRPSSGQSPAVDEFQDLIARAPTEAELERFIAAHYREVFGFKYDRVETQLWLRYPEIDIADRSRRLDVFLRNSVSQDWELFELKRPVRLTGKYRDVPVLAAEVAKAAQQVRAYERLLKAEPVKRHLAQLGIEYYEPELNLVIGRRPSIPLDQWRWLQATAAGNVKLLTYDDLAAEMRARVSQRQSLL